jgi:hypothetical protein
MSTSQLPCGQFGNDRHINGWDRRVAHCVRSRSARILRIRSPVLKPGCLRAVLLRRRRLVLLIAPAVDGPISQSPRDGAVCREGLGAMARERGPAG